MVCLDKYGWPVELIGGRPVTNLIRRLLHTRRIITKAEWKRREARWMSNAVGAGTTQMSKT